jgi:hypothetical protein
MTYGSDDTPANVAIIALCVLFDKMSLVEAFIQLEIV